MEQKIGYSLIDSNNKEIEIWNSNLYPNPIILPNGDHVHSAALNVNYSGYKLVERWEIKNIESRLVEIGQTISYDGERIVVTTQYRDPNKIELLEYSASKRYDKEKSGVFVGNNRIYTDRQSQAMITGIMTLLSVNPNTTISFKTANGFIEANSVVMYDISLAVANHVQTCFSIESGVSVNVSSNAITSFDEIDTAYNINNQKVE